MRLSQEFKLREDGNVVLSDMERERLVKEVISPLNEIYGNPLLYEGVRKILDQQATILLAQCERFVEGKYFL